MEKETVCLSVCINKQLSNRKAFSRKSASFEKQGRDQRSRNKDCPWGHINAPGPDGEFRKSVKQWWFGIPDLFLLMMLFFHQLLSSLLQKIFSERKKIWDFKRSGDTVSEWTFHLNDPPLSSANSDNGNGGQTAWTYGALLFYVRSQRSNFLIMLS